MVRSRLAGLLCIIPVLLAGCDASVPPPSDRYPFSIYGVLDPARDTQWVRVEPLVEPTTDGAPESLDATVTLTNLDTGQEWTLHDSLMVVQTELQHNFWTAAPIQPGTSYRLAARRSTGDTTWVRTQTPDRPPTIEMGGNSVFVDDTHELAGVKARYFTFGTHVDVSYYERVRRTPTGYRVKLQPGRDIDRLNLFRLDSAKVVVATGGPDWPEWGRYHDATIHEIARPDTFSNVRGGGGMVSGVYTETAPLR